MANEPVLQNSNNILTRVNNAQPSSKLVKRTGNRLAELSSDLVVSEGKLEAGAFLGSVGMTHLGTLSAVAEAVVQMHPAAAQGCVQILNAYAMGAADVIRRTVR